MTNELLKTKYILVLAVPILMTLMIAMASAITLNSPTNGGNYSTTLTVTCTNDGAGWLQNATNATFYYNAASGAAKTVLTTIQNTSYNQSVFTGSVSIAALSDLTTYNFNCSIINSTGGSQAANSTSVIGVTIDNTNPSVSMTVTPASTSVGRTVKYTSVISDATSNVQYQTCTAVDPDKAFYNLSTSASDLDYGLNRLSSAGDWTFNCTAVDYAGNVKLSSATVDTSLAGEIQDETTGTSGTTTTGGFNLDMKTIAVIGGIVLIYLVLRKKG